MERNYRQNVTVPYTPPSQEEIVNALAELATREVHSQEDLVAMGRDLRDGPTPQVPTNLQMHACMAACREEERIDAGFASFIENFGDFLEGLRWEQQ